MAIELRELPPADGSDKVFPWFLVSTVLNCVMTKVAALVLAEMRHGLIMCVSSRSTISG